MFRRRFMARRQVGLMFTDQSSSKLNAQQAGMVYGWSPTGKAQTGATFSTGAAFSNIHLYAVSTGDELTGSFANNSYLYLVIHYNNSYYIIGLENNKLIYEQTTDIATYNANSKFHWLSSGTADGFYLRNRNNTIKYLKTDADSTLTLVDNDNTFYFSCVDAILYKRISSGKNWYIYSYGTQVAINSTLSNVSAYLYTFSTSVQRVNGKISLVFSLSRISEDRALSNQQCLLVIKDTGGNYYLVGKGSGTQTSTLAISPSSISDDTIVFEVTSFIYDYYFVANKNSDKYTLRCYNYTNYYLYRPTTFAENQSLSCSTSSYSFNYSDPNGLYISTISNSSVPFGVKSIGSQIDADAVANNTGTAIVFRKNGSTWSSYYGSLNAGDTYAIAVRKTPEDENHPGDNTASYYLVGYDGTNLVAHEFATLEDIVVTSDCEFTATAGTNGCGLVIGNKGLNINNNNLAMLDVSADWLYIGDASVPDNSRLWTVTTQTTDYYTEYANSDLEANTAATDTTCDIFLVQNGKVQIQADEFVDGETYVLVFVDGGNHYAACVNGTDIVPVLYANSLPKNLPSDYHFVAEASGQGFILKHNNQAMGVAVNAKLTLGYNAVWTYTGGTNE